MANLPADERARDCLGQPLIPGHVYLIDGPRASVHHAAACGHIGPRIRHAAGRSLLPTLEPSPVPLVATAQWQALRDAQRCDGRQHHFLGPGPTCVCGAMSLTHEPCNLGHVHVVERGVAPRDDGSFRKGDREA